MAVEIPRETFLATHGTTILLASALVGLVLAMQFGLLERPHPLLGKTAPDFRMKTLNGTEVTLAEHLGKDVVVLDFFATWCPPCRKSLPHFAALSKEFEGQPVSIYAVNVSEESTVVEEYFKENALQIEALLDEGGLAAEDYGVSGIPHQVIIGRDGSVQYVGSGFGLGDESRLHSAIEKLLAGEVLVTPAPGA